MPAKQKILFLVTKSNWGGAQRYVYDLATSLDPTLYEPVVVAGGNGPLFERLKERGVRTIPLTYAQRDVHLLKEVHLLHELMAILKSERPDVLHVNSSKLGGLGSLAGQLCRTPCIIFTAHGWPFHERHRSTLWRALAYFFSWLTCVLAHHIITITQRDYARGKKMILAGAMHYVPLGINPPDFLAREQARAHLATIAPSAKNYATWIVSIGELHKNKGFDVALEALAPLLKTNPDYLYIIMGEGEEREALTQDINEKGIDSQVLLVGNVPDAAKYLPAFNLFLIASRKEGLPYTLLEAGLANVPLVSTDVGGIPDVVLEGLGTLTPPESSSKLYDALAKALTDPNARENAALLQARIAREFSLAKMVTLTCHIYQR